MGTMFYYYWEIRGTTKIKLFQRRVVLFPIIYGDVLGKSRVLRNLECLEPYPKIPMLLCTMNLIYRHQVCHGWLFVPLNSTSGELINQRHKICLQLEPVLNMPLVQKHSYSNSFWSSTCHFCPCQPLSFFLNIVLPFIHVLFQSSRLRQQFFFKKMHARTP